VQTGRDSLDPATSDFDLLADQLNDATARLARAGKALDSPFLFPFRGVPFISSQLDSSRSLVASGETAGRSLLEAVEALDAAFAELDGGGDVPQVMADLDQVFQGVQRELLSINLGPSNGLLATLARHRDLLATEINVALDSLEDARRLARGAAGFFEQGRYLVVAANPSEMRVGMGMILQVGILTTAADGSLFLDSVQPSHDVTPAPGTVRIVDEDLARNWSWLHPERLWENIALTPRFPVVARQAAAYWRQIGPLPVDGVISIDSQAVADLVGVVGHVTVDGVTHDAASAREFLANGQYQFVGGADERNERLGEFAVALFSEITERGLQDEEILSVVVDAVRARRIMMWSPHAQQLAAWQTMGADGDPSEDSLHVSVANHAASKLDWFLRTEAQLSVESSGGRRRIHVDVNLNNAVPGGQPDSVVGTVSAPRGTYVGIVSFSVPGDATAVTITGAGGEAPRINAERFRLLADRDSSRPVVSGADGPKQTIAMVVRVEPGRQRIVSLSFELASSSNTLEILPDPSWNGIQWVNGWPSDRSVTVDLQELSGDSP